MHLRDCAWVQEGCILLEAYLSVPYAEGLGGNGMFEEIGLDLTNAALLILAPLVGFLAGLGLTVISVVALFIGAVATYLGFI